MSKKIAHALDNTAAKTYEASTAAGRKVGGKTGEKVGAVVADAFANMTLAPIRRLVDRDDD